MGLQNKLIEAKYFYLQNSKPYCKELVNVFSEGIDENLSYSINASLKSMDKNSKVTIDVIMNLKRNFEIIDCKITRHNDDIKVTEKYLVDDSTQTLHYSFIKDGEKTKREFPISSPFHISTPAISTLMFMTLKDSSETKFKLYSSPNEWDFIKPPTLDEIEIANLDMNENFSHFEIDGTVFKTSQIEIIGEEQRQSEIILSEFYNMPLELKFESVTIRASSFKNL